MPKPPVAVATAGRRLVVAHDERLLRVFDVDSGRELAHWRAARPATDRAFVAELRGHGSYVHGLVFSPDGSRLIPASGDYTLRVWDTRSPRERMRWTPADTKSPPCDPGAHACDIRDR